MVLLHTVPYLRKKNHFTDADRFGSWVAHQDIVRAVLQYGGVEGVHFYVPYFREYSKEEIPDGIRELRAEFPSHDIDLKRPSDLHEMARRHRYILADDFEVFSSLALSRHSGQKCLFPVSTVVHTVPRQTSLIGYSNVLLLAEPFDAIVTTSAAGEKAIQNIFEDIQHFIASRLKIQFSKRMPIVNIPLAIDDNFLSPRDPESARRELNLPAKAVIIMYLGRLSETFKADLEPLLAAYRLLSIDHPNLHLMIAGHDKDGKYTSIVKTMADQLEIRNQVTVITNFPYSIKPLLYAACDIFVSPVDNIQETFGLSILEAMACALPVVASDWSGYRDLVAHGESGFLARTIWNPEAARLAEIVAPFPIKSEYFLAQQTVVDINELRQYLKILINNEDLRHRFGTNGRARVLERFCWRVVMNRYKDLWKEQWQQLDQTGQVVEWHAPLNIEKQFGHFATALLDAQTIFKRTSHVPLLSSGRRIDESRVPYPIDIHELRRVMSQCEQHPQTINDLSIAGDGVTTSAVTWLWKKGYIEPDTVRGG